MGLKQWFLSASVVFALLPWLAPFGLANAQQLLPAPDKSGRLVLPRSMQFFDSFENRINAGGRHGWTRILAKVDNSSREADWDAKNLNAEVNNSSRFQYVRKGARVGSYALRVIVKDGDHVAPSDDHNGNERTELVRRYLTDTGEGVEGDQRWYGFSFKLDDNFPPMPQKDFAIVTQFLKENNKSAPYPNPTISVVLKYKNSKHYLELYTRQRRKIRIRWKVVTYDLGEIRPGEWTDLAFHIRWSTKNDGFWQVWRDKKLVASKSRTATLPGLNHPTFNKIGFYRSKATDTFSGLYDAYWMGKVAPSYAK